MTTPLELLEFLYDALREPVGIVISTDNVEHTRNKLYGIIKDKAPHDPALRELALIVSPTTVGQLWIVRKCPEPSTTNDSESTP